METNELGLTREEKIMFLLLSIILFVAVGVLFVYKFSFNERGIETNTPTEEQSMSNIEDRVNDGDTISLVENLIEAETKEDLQKTENNNDELVNVAYLKQTSTSSSKEWDFPVNIVTEAFAYDEIFLNKSVVLENGSTAQAVVTVRKLEGNCYNIINTSNNRFVVTPGTYKYYYTYNNKTKEKLLIVHERLENEVLELLEFSDKNSINSSLTNESFSNMKDNTERTKIEKINNQYNITINKQDNNSNKIALLLTFAENITYIKSNTLGLLIDNDNELWHQSLMPNQVILFIDSSLITNNELTNLSFTYNNDKTSVITINLAVNLVNETTKEEISEEESDMEPDKTIKPDIDKIILSDKDLEMEKLSITKNDYIKEEQIIAFVDLDAYLLRESSRLFLNKT